jgi:P pilus assembly chaperone PapD
VTRWSTLTGVVSLGAAIAADAGVLVAPTRLVFEGRERSGEFVLVNEGDRVERFRISLADRRMNEQGRLEPVDELGAEEHSARGMLRFSPRQVELRPREPQTIRILLRKPGDLERGEYRAHLQIQQIPPPRPAAPADDGPRRFGVRIQPIFGVSVPVIVRHGTLGASGRIDGLELVRLDAESMALRFAIHREGDRSLYGDVVAHWLPAGGEAVEVGRTNGVALYTPNGSRPFSLPLEFPGGVVPKGGRVKLRYVEPENAGSSLIAEAGLVLPSP